MKRTAIFLGILITAALIGNAVWIYVSGAELEAQLSALLTNHQPLSVADLAPPKISPKENAATYLRRAQEQVQAVEREVLYSNDEYLGDALLTDDCARKARSAFDAFPSLIPLLEQAVNCPQYASQLNYKLDAAPFIEQLIKGAQSPRSATQVLNLHALLLATEGKPEEALQSTITTLKLIRHSEGEPTLMTYLVSCACRAVAIHGANVILRSGEISATCRVSLDSELARHDDARAFKRAWQTDRAFGISWYHDTIPWGRHWITRGFGNRNLCYYLTFMGREIDSSDLAYSERSTPTELIGFPLANQMLPATDAVLRANARSRACIRCLRVLNALQALPADRQTEHVDISALGLPPEAIQDPCSGKPLIVKKRPEGWLIYSVGDDRKDDGGNLVDYVDCGLGPIAGAVNHGKAAKAGAEQ